MKCSNYKKKYEIVKTFGFHTKTIFISFIKETHIPITITKYCNYIFFILLSFTKQKQTIITFVTNKKNFKDTWRNI